MAAPRRLCGHGQPRSQFPARGGGAGWKGTTSLRLRRHGTGAKPIPRARKRGPLHKRTAPITLERERFGSAAE